MDSPHGLAGGSSRSKHNQPASATRQIPARGAAKGRGPPNQLFRRRLDSHPVQSELPAQAARERSRFGLHPSLPDACGAKENDVRIAHPAIFGLWRHAACAVFVAAACFLLAAGPAAAQGVVKSKHGDWELRCETPPGAQKEQCALLQSVAAEDRPNVNLVVILLKTADGKSRLLRVIAPLGVLLPNGLGLKVDQTDVGRAGFVRCLPTGCVAEVIMDDKLLDQLNSGQMATFIIYQTPEEGIGIPLTLTGLKDGFSKLP
jgi:invasion protein IalB